ncbi:MAG TPA: HAD family hydrolase [Chloroflexia bacterium]|nr:HAD family hydrolase [Chloroflexia bacterium]
MSFNGTPELLPQEIDTDIYNINVKLAIMLDVDNTLIDNDKVKEDVSAQMLALIGEQWSARFWEIYEQVRKETDVVDIPNTLKRIQPELNNEELYHHLYRLWNDFPYRRYIYPGVFELLKYINTIGRPIIVSDGDPSFQLRKIVTSGLARAVNGDVLIYAHKQNHLEDIELALPAYHYVMVDDKPNLLALIKNYFEDKVTTVLVKQGKYAFNQELLKNSRPRPDMQIKQIADLRKFTPEMLYSDRF